MRFVTQPQRRGSRLGLQAGATAVEFALVAIIFFTMMLGIVDFGRWLFAVNSAAEATRFGARIAVVCDLNSPAVRSRMMPFLPGGTVDDDIGVTYIPNGCDVTTCTSVRVALSNVSISSIAWFLPASLPLPVFATTLPRESMKSSIDGSANPQCV